MRIRTNPQSSSPAVGTADSPVAVSARDWHCGVFECRGDRQVCETALERRETRPLTHSGACYSRRLGIRTWDADSLSATLMGENVESRRAYIEDHALEVKNLDI